VIGLGLCPFASAPYLERRILFSVHHETDLAPLTNEVLEVCRSLTNRSSHYETALFIAPHLKMDFESFNDYVMDLQDALDDRDPLTFVLVAFHPHFRYDQEDVESTTNATNRSPYPMIHVLKNSSLTMASQSGVNINQLLKSNQSKLSAMSWDQIRSRYK